MSCPDNVALLLPVTVNGRPQSALLDSGCSITLIKADGVTSEQMDGCSTQALETMNGQQFWTQGWTHLSSLCIANTELGPVRAHVVPTLPFGVDIVIGLSLMLRHGCWIGKERGHVVVRWGAAAAGMQLVSTRPEDARALDAQPVGTRPVGARSVGMRLEDARALDAQLVGTRPEDTQPVGTRPVGTRSVGMRPEDARALDAQPVGMQPEDTRLAGTRLVDGKLENTPAVATIDDCDFVAVFHDQRWTVCWKWKGKEEPAAALHRWNYAVAAVDQVAFDAEVSAWVDEGILVKYNRLAHGDIHRFLPMMAVRQEKGNKHKVRPVFDYRRLNKTVESHPGGATPLCAERLRQWRQLGKRCAILDLRKAYLQVHVHPSLWTHQAVWWHGEVYLLTRLGFGLSSAPKVMTTIVEWILATDATIHNAVSSYIDDLFVMEDCVSAEYVRGHLRIWGLETKTPERLGSALGVRVLGIRVDDHLQWGRDRPLPVVSEQRLTRRQVHSVLGEWIGHFPVVGWLRVVCGFLQRSTANDGVKWDAPVSAETMDHLREAAALIKTQGDPAKGQWLVDPVAPINVWVDASSIALGVVLEIEGHIVEDAAWMRPKNDSAHINRCELDAAVRGINMALLWGRRKMTLITDSATVFGWLQAVIHRTHNVRTRALSEVLIRRRLDTVREVVAQEHLDINVRLVPSADNLADRLTRVPSKWLRTQKGSPTDMAVAGVARTAPTLHDVRAIHDRCHFGVNRTLELARERFGDRVSRKMVKRVTSRCDRCARVDPAVTVRWDRGPVAASKVWQRLATDITHVEGRPFLSVIDTASGFTMWRALRNESAQEMCHYLRQIFSEFGPPESLMSDNGTIFRSRLLEILLQDWEVNHELTCAYRSQGNGVVERVHRTVKRTVKRANCTVAEAVFWVNNTRGEHANSPFELVFAARPRKPGVSVARTEVHRSPSTGQPDPSQNYADCTRNPFVVGDSVYLRRPDGQCDQEWSGPHRVTLLRSSVSVVLDDDNISRHVSHLRRVPRPGHSQEAAPSNSSDEDDEGDMAAGGDAEGQPRRSARARRPPRWCQDFIMD